MHSSSEERGGGTLRCVPSRWRSERREGMKILGDERGEMEKRTDDGESGVGMDPELPHGGYWTPVEKSDERSQQGSPRDWEYRLLRRLEREDSRPWLQETGCRPRGAWVVDEREGRRRGEERRRSERERWRERKVSSEPAPV